MSESLKQKAKTIRQRLAHGCCENWNSGSPCDKECDEPLIELSVAQQEIDKKEKEIDSWIDAYNKINETYQRERGLQKQKLQPFYDTLVAMVPKTVKIEEYDKGTKESWIVQTADPSEWSMFIDSLDGWLVKFKEMLK
jgi:hypothetical protein